MSPDLQALLTELWRENISAYRANMADAQARAREVMQSHGIAINVPADADVEATRRRMLADQEQVAKQSKISGEMIAAVSAELAG